jgi:hypothetical protein
MSSSCATLVGDSMVKGCMFRWVITKSSSVSLDESSTFLDGKQAGFIIPRWQNPLVFQSTPFERRQTTTFSSCDKLEVVGCWLHTGTQVPLSSIICKHTLADRRERILDTILRILRPLGVGM